MIFAFLTFLCYFSKMRFHETVFIARQVNSVAEPRPDSGERFIINWVDFDNFLQLARNDNFAVPIKLRIMMYEALLDESKKSALKNKIFG